MGNVRRKFLYVALSAGEGTPVEVLRVGTFTDMRGREVEIGENDLDAYVANFAAGVAGQEIPVDVDHELGQAAGWLRKLWREGEKLLASVEWNELGKTLVGEARYKYISAAIDLAEKFLLSISLTNFPAVPGLAPVALSRDAQTFEVEPGLLAWLARLPAVLGVRGAEGAHAGAPLPAALADGVAGSVRIGEYLQARIHKAFTNIADELAASGMLSVEERKELSGAIGAALETFAGQAGEAAERMISVGGPDLYMYSQRAGREAATSGTEVSEMGKSEEELREEIRQEEAANLARERKAEAELRKQIRAEERELLEAERARHDELVTFAQTVCGGEGGQGLSEPVEEVVAFLEAVPEAAQAQARRMLQAKVVDFGEVGSRRDGEPGGNGRLDPRIAAMLQKWVDGGESVEAFFEANPEIGEMSGYDLAEFRASE